MTDDYTKEEYWYTNCSSTMKPKKNNRRTLTFMDPVKMRHNKQN